MPLKPINLQQREYANHLDHLHANSKHSKTPLVQAFGAKAAVLRSASRSQLVSTDQQLPLTIGLTATKLHSRSQVLSLFQVRQMDAQDFQQRIARAKEAARLASLAVSARSAASAVPLARPLAPPPTASSAPVPEDVRQRVERLVDFVRRNGPAFEAAAVQRERGNPEFAFLVPGAPFHDFYQWRKRQVCGVGAPPPPSTLQPPGGAPPPPPDNDKDPMAALSVGAMANVCKLARASGVPPYAPIPPEMAANVGSLPPVEPGRLEIRLADFYRSD